jgi:hypothetical protein
MNWMYVILQGVVILIALLTGLLRIERRLTRVETILEMIRNNNIKKGGN